MATALLGKKIGHAVGSTIVVAALSLSLWLLFPGSYLAPALALGLLAWAAVISLEKPQPTAGFFLMLGQVPFIGLVIFSSYPSALSAGLMTAIIIDSLLSFLAFVLFLLKAREWR